MIYFLLVLMVLIWSVNFIVAKEALMELPPFALLFLRVLFSNALLVGLYIGSGQRRRRPLQRSDWKWFALLGFFGIAMNQTGFTVGIHHTTVAHSALIISLTPIFVLLLATRMKLEAYTRTKLLGMALAFAGVVVITAEHGFSSHSPTFLGDLLTFGGSVSFALYTVNGKRVADRYDTLSLTTFIYLAGAAVVFPLAGWELFNVEWELVSWRGWLGALYMAAGASVAGYMIFYYALKKLAASRVIAFSYLQPVIATLLSILILGEKLTPYLLVGGPLVLLGVVLAERGRG